MKRNKIILFLIIIIFVATAVFLVRYLKSSDDNGEPLNNGQNQINNLNDNQTDNDADNVNDVKGVNQIDQDTMDSFIQCLAEAGMVVYGTRTCPACLSFVNSFGGYDRVESLYVECHDEGERCQAEMQTNYVPEIQIKGQLYEGPRDHASLGKTAGCPIP